MATDKSLLLNVSDDDEDKQLILRVKRNKRLSDYYGVRLRTHLYVLIGFVLGFLMAYATMLYYDRQLWLDTTLDMQSTTNIDYYQTGYMLNTPAESNISIAEQLSHEVRILCMILTCPKYHETRAKHLLATWGRRCTKLIFISSAEDAELGAIPLVDTDEYYDLWNKTREGFRYVYENYVNEFDWFLKADDDTYIVMENLRYMLYAYPTATPIFFGYEMIRYDVHYMSGGASYVLSRAALQRFNEVDFNNDTLCPAAQHFGAEDFYMGICLQNVGVHLADSRTAIPLDNRSKFFPLNLSAYMHPNTSETIPDWIYEMTPHPIDTGVQCCSNYSIAFHYTDPQNMYLYEYFIYYLRLFGNTQQSAAALPQKLSLEDVERMYSTNQSNTLVDLQSETLPDNF